MGAHDGCFTRNAGPGQTRDFHLGYYDGRARGFRDMVPGLRGTTGTNGQVQGCQEQALVTKQDKTKAVPTNRSRRNTYWQGRVLGRRLLRAKPGTAIRP